MKPLILIDLDDTLLSISMDRFLPAYLELLGNKLKNTIPSGQMIPTLLAATQKMVEKSYPAGTLEEVFDQNYYGVLGFEKEKLFPILEDFYDNDFCGLHALAEPRQEAIDLINNLFTSGYKIVIATNPLFPRKATAHRLSWAGVNPEHYPFSLVTTYEHFHFSKPHPAYLAEIMAQLGWIFPYAVMIGNDWDQDILPAAQLGLPTFWVSPERKDFPVGIHPDSSQGKLSDVFPWILSLPQTHSQEEDFKSIPAMLALLKSTPAALDTLIKRYPDLDWMAETWLSENTNYLCAMKNIGFRIGYSFAQNNQTLSKSVDHASLDKFTASRTEAIKSLESLSTDQWNDRSCRLENRFFTPLELTKQFTSQERILMNRIFHKAINP